MKFAEREIRRGNCYDGVIMDPPSYGRGPKGEIWKIEDAIHPLVKLCASLLSDTPLFFLINSYTTGLAPSVLAYMLSVEVVFRLLKPIWFFPAVLPDAGICKRAAAYSPICLRLTKTKVSASVFLSMPR